MKRFFFLFLTLLSVHCLNAQTINGLLGAESYYPLATWTQANTGFGDHGIKSLNAVNDGTNLYVMIVGECENNGNDLFLFINVSDVTTGVNAGTQLPAGNDGLSPFNNCRPTHDFQVDFGTRLTVAGTDAFSSIIDYRSGGNTDTYIGNCMTSGAATTVSSGAFNGVIFAYKHEGTMSAVTNQGWEIKIPLSALGATASSSFELMAAYGNNDFFSANTLPEIAGQSGTNLAVNPNFNSIGGIQHTTSSVLDIELTSFKGSTAKGQNILDWKTASEKNAAHFDVQRSSDNTAWASIGQVKAVNNAYGADYQFVDAQPLSGTNYYRLQMVDANGSTGLSKIVAVTANGNKSLKVYPNPAKDVLTIVTDANTEGVSIFDINGRLALSVVDQSQNVNIQNLASGVYFVRMMDKTGFVGSPVRFVKQ